MKLADRIEEPMAGATGNEASHEYRMKFAARYSEIKKRADGVPSGCWGAVP